MVVKVYKEASNNASFFLERRSRGRMLKEKYREERQTSTPLFFIVLWGLRSMGKNNEQKKDTEISV